MIKSNLQVNKHTASFYNKFSLFYPLVDIFLKPQKQILFNEINKLPHGYLLEIGVGNGSHLQLYKTHKVIGIDTSLSMLSIAKKKTGDNVELHCMDGEALAFADECFDYVVLSHVIAVADHPERLLEEVYRVLKPKGSVYILNHFTPANWLRHIDYSLQLLSGLFHFRSVFYVTDLTVLNRFFLLKAIDCGLLSYFKLLIYQKA